MIFQAMVEKVCVIGAGPSGLGILCWFAKQKREGKVVINIVVVIIIIIMTLLPRLRSHKKNSVGGLSPLVIQISAVPVIIFNIVVTV